MTPETLAALGLDRLAKLVLDEAAGNAPFKRIVTAALAGAKGPDAVAAIIDRRLASLERALGFVSWDRRRAFVADLKATLSTIADELGAADPAAASERLLRFLGGAGRVLDRVDDSSGTLLAVYEDAAARFPALLVRMTPEEREGLAPRLVPLLLADEHGFTDAALLEAVPVLAAAELEALDRALEQATASTTDSRDWQRQRQHGRLLRARQAIADAGSDVDAFIALEMQRPEPSRDSLEIAERLLRADRTAEALAWIRKPCRSGLRAATAPDVADASAGIDVLAQRQVRLEIAILAARKDVEAAQALRWSSFKATLDADLLRAFLAALPDFEDDEALERAFAHVVAEPRRHRALHFLLDWPRLDLASALVLRHAAEWDGRQYDVLAPAAETLEDKHPAAAAILFRTLVDDIVGRGRSAAYGHAARYLARLASMPADAVASAGLPDHRTYRDGLQRAHGRKHGFWTLVKAED